MLLTWTPQAWEDYLYWQHTDKRTVNESMNCCVMPCETPLKGWEAGTAPVRSCRMLVAPYQSGRSPRLQSGRTKRSPDRTPMSLPLLN